MREEERVPRSFAVQPGTLVIHTSNFLHRRHAECGIVIASDGHSVTIAWSVTCRIASYHRDEVDVYGHPWKVVA